MRVTLMRKGRSISRGLGLAERTCFSSRVQKGSVRASGLKSSTSSNSEQIAKVHRFFCLIVSTGFAHSEGALWFAFHMALTATILRLRLELNDLERGVYESLDLRIAQHPSESDERVVARIFAYALLYEQGLEFGKGLSMTDEPALLKKSLMGDLEHWVDVGTPSAERLHAANKKAERVSVVCHKGQAAMSREAMKRKVHRAERLNVYYLEPSFIKEIAASIGRNNEWSLMRCENELTLHIGDQAFQSTLSIDRLPQAE